MLVDSVLVLRISSISLNTAYRSTAYNLWINSIKGKSCYIWGPWVIGKHIIIHNEYTDILLIHTYKDTQTYTRTQHTHMY